MNNAERWDFVRRVVSNSLAHYIERPHQDVEPEWIERAIAEPDHTGYDGRDLYFCWIDEAKKWLRVVVDDDRLLTAYLDWRLTRRFGRLS